MILKTSSDKIISSPTSSDILLYALVYRKSDNSANLLTIQNSHFINLQKDTVYTLWGLVPAS